VGVAARTEEASGEALCGVRRANDGSLACGASRDASSDQRGEHMTADRGHPRPRSPPVDRESCCPRAECHAPPGGLSGGT